MKRVIESQQTQIRQNYKNIEVSHSMNINKILNQPIQAYAQGVANTTNISNQLNEAEQITMFGNPNFR